MKRVLKDSFALVFCRVVCFFLLGLTGASVIAQKSHALQPAKTPVSCPEGIQNIEEWHYPFFQPELDLFSGLHRDLIRISVCEQSSFPSYRKFTKDEFDSISALMRSSEYQSRKDTSTDAELALWIERALKGVVEPRLEYRLRLLDAYTRNTSDAGSNTVAPRNLISMFHIVRDGHTEFASDDVDLVRLQMQLAFLSHMTGMGLATEWLQKAVDGLDRLPVLRDPNEPGLTSDERRYRQLERFRYKWLRRNRDALMLCFDAPAALIEALCKADLNDRYSQTSSHGIEALAHWALRGPTSPESTEEEGTLRERLKQTQNSTSTEAADRRAQNEAQIALGPSYLGNRTKRTHEKMQAILHERSRNPLFKTYFDRLFIKAIKGSTHRYAKGSYYYCDLFDLINRFTHGQCHLDGTPVWAAAHERFPDLMAELREERRQEVLEYAAHYLLNGNPDHRSVRWAQQQDDFDKAIKLYQKKRKR